jgi:serine/threonine-protein kinase
MPANRYPTTQASIDDLMEFLAPRVAMNHNSRLVLYLREIGFLSDEEVEEILAAAGPRGAVRRPRTDRRLVPSVAALQFLVFLAIAGAGGAIQTASGRLSGDVAGLASGAGLQVSPTETGYLRVVVDPWATVFVDGDEVATTPIARSIPLPPGSHFVKLANPYYETRDVEVHIRPGETEVLDLELAPLHEPLVEGTPPGAEEGG